MTCLESQPLLHAYFDDELELSRSFEVGEHLSSCAECSAEVRKWERLRAEIAESAFDLDMGDAALLRLRRTVRPSRPIAWKGMTAALAAAAMVLIAVALPGRFTKAGDEREIVDSHLRSLAGGHLIDVPSSDRHTVKPWFQGKLEFAPSVPDLSNENFLLQGGRIDVIGGRRAAAIVYKRREHIINLWISQGMTAAAQPQARDLDGYHMVSWSRDGLTYSTVSDLEASELREFADDFRAH